MVVIQVRSGRRLFKKFYTLHDPPYLWATFAGDSSSGETLTVGAFSPVTLSL
jgi:hypothetical protein